jgi:hypothetical protein
MEVKRRRGRRRKKVMDDLTDKRGYSHLKEAQDRSMWRNRFGRGFGPVVRQNTEWMNVRRWRVSRLSRGLRRESAAACFLWDCGFESRRQHACLALVSVVCCQVEVSATGWSLVQRIPTECGVFECDREAWQSRGCYVWRGLSDSSLRLPK